MTDQMYLENLEEYVNDEKKIVTYKWLSKTLTVHVNLAKQMLYSFVQKERNKKDNDQLTVTYFVSGFMEQNGEKIHKMQVVPEEKLEPTKQAMQPVTSCHVYSVQKCKIKDTSVLYMTDVDLFKEQIHNSNKYSAIKCTCAKLRSNDELLKLRTVAQPTSNAPSFTKPKSQDTLSSSSNKTINKKPAGIAGMFATGGKKKEDKVDDSNKKTETKEKKTETAAKPKAKPGIANFFGNQASKPKKSVPEEKKTETNTETKMPGKKSPEPKKQEPKKQTPKKSPSPKPQAKAKSRKQKAEDSDEEDASQQKKRRRIKAAAWSDSSSDEEEAMEEEPIPPPSPPRDPTPPPKEPSPSPEKKEPTPSPEKKENVGPSQAEHSGGKRRGRKRQKKMVSKTFVDDDGFMVTEKVWEDVSESASEADEPIPPTPPVKQTKTTAGDKKKKTPTKKVSPGKAGTGKQTSLMSFFKKK